MCVYVDRKSSTLITRLSTADFTKQKYNTLNNWHTTQLIDRTCFHFCVCYKFPKID